MILKTIQIFLKRVTKYNEDKDKIMKRIDFEHGTITSNILGAALPMLVAQILSLLYNIVDVYKRQP